MTQFTTTTTQPEQLKEELRANSTLPSDQFNPSVQQVSGNSYTYTYQADLTAAQISTINSIIAAHVPDPLYGLPEDQAARSVDVLSISNTAAETVIYSFPIAGGSTSAGYGFRLEMDGSYLNNSGATRTLTLVIKLGSTTIYKDVSPNLTANAGERSWDTAIDIRSNGATQTMKGWFSLGSTKGASNTVGLGNISSPDTINASIRNDSVGVDLSQKQVVSVSFQHSVANANLYISRKFVKLSRI